MLYDVVIQAMVMLRFIAGANVRINARLDSMRERKLRDLQARMGFTASEAVKLGLDLLYSQQLGQPKARLEALLSSDLIGCADGPADLATEYKRYLADGLQHKHGAG